MVPDDKPTAEEVVTFTSNRQGLPHLRFLHYNDVYHVEPRSREPVGGIARFQTLCKYYADGSRFSAQPELLTFFSGDAFNPSLESSVTKGRHMVPILNNTRIDAACLGNHDLDFGMEQFMYLASQCRFPWLVANVTDPALGDGMPLGNCKRTVMLTASNGFKTLNSLPPNLQYASASKCALELAPWLRSQGADIVVALTHQRQPNDEKLARNLRPGDVDIILGGHDHTYIHSVINGTHILRSGTDFKQLSYIEVFPKPPGVKGWDFNIYRRDVVTAIPEDKPTVELVEKMTGALKAKLEKPMGYTSAPLDARFTTVRLKESNLGNFVCDLMRFHYGADCCIMAAGTIRGDQIYPPGVLRVKDMMNCFPFEDPCVVVAVSGKAILLALENAVGKYPALEGRFPQVSNIVFTFDPSKPEGARCSEVHIADEPIDLVREYKLVTRDYMVRGKDGFTSLMLESEGGDAKSIVSEENGLLISMVLRQYFMSLKILGRWKNWGHLGRHWGEVHHDLHQVHPVREPLTPSLANDKTGVVKQPEADGKAQIPSLVGAAQRTDSKHRKPHPDETHLQHSDSEDDSSDLPAVPSEHSEHERKLIIMRKVMRKWWRLAGLEGHPSMCDDVGEEFGVHWTQGISPRIEGRIRIVGDEKKA